MSNKRLTPAMQRLIVQLDGNHLVFNNLSGFWHLRDPRSVLIDWVNKATAEALVKRGLIAEDHSIDYRHLYYLTPAGRAVATPAPDDAVLTSEDIAPDGYMRPCESCNGSGTRYDGIYHRICPACDGTGIYTPGEDDDPPPSADVLTSEDGEPAFTVRDRWSGDVLFTFGDPHRVALRVRTDRYRTRTLVNGFPATDWLKAYDQLAPYLSHAPANPVAPDNFADADWRRDLMSEEAEL